MELKQYFYLIRKWIWLLALGTILGAGAAYFYSTAQEPVYESTAKVMISQPSRDQLSDLGYLSGRQLVQTYAELLLTSPVLNEVSESLNAKITAEMISVQQVRDTNILSVSVEYTDPAGAAEIADKLIEVLVRQNEELEASRFLASEASLQSQIEIVQNQISSLETQIETTSEENLENQLTTVEEQINILQNDIVDLQIKIADLQSQISELQNPDEESDSQSNSTLVLERQTQIQQYQLDLEQKQGMLELYQELYFNLLSYDSNGQSANLGGTGSDSQYQNTLALYQQIYANLLSDYEAVRLSRLENTVNVTSVEPAMPEMDPVRPKPVINTLLGAVIGLIMAAGGVFLIEYMDDTVKNPDEIKKLSSYPVIGYIPTYSQTRLNGNQGTNVYVQENPRSPVADAFRSLRTNIEFSSAAHPTNTIMVTSPEPQVGKSNTAANLAAILAQGGHKVFLVDADLRKPNVHRYFNFSNRVGLSEYFRGDTKISNTFNYVESTKRLIAIPSGKLPPNPTELLASDKMSTFLEQLKIAGGYIIIDTAPLMVADPIVLTPKVDGVLLVIEPGKTKLSSLKASIDQLEHAKARIIGIALNNISKQSGYYYESYYHAAYYQTEE